MSSTMDKKVPFSRQDILKIAKAHPTPFHIYDESAMRENAKRFQKAFSVLTGFKEYFAVKALPNPFILKILKEEGFGADCSSLPELMLSEKVGIVGENIMFTSNETPLEDYEKAKELGAIINLDDISHIEYLERIGLPTLLSLRYNPGPARTGNTIIGDPKEAKYGFTKKQIFEGYAISKKRGVKRFGLHTMVASNELNEQYFIETARMLFDLALEIKGKLGINLEFVNLGGGIGIPYKPEQRQVDYDKIAKGIKKLYDEMIVPELDGMKIYMECGRVITGPYGYLVTTALHLKHIYKEYVGVDACMANLMRPGMYGSYHHITVLGKENAKRGETYDVVGSLCENNDKFAIDRKLPEISTGDILVIHDTGAHGHSMGFNYNAKLRSAELLLRPNGEIVEIRRAEKIEDYFSTLDFKKVKQFK
jgi:diaminopimelate decarboxylase